MSLTEYLGYRTVCDSAGRIEFVTSVDEIVNQLAADISTADKNDPCRGFRDEFLVPKDSIYFVGNSLGPQPVKCVAAVSEALTSWKDRGVAGHFSGPRPWLNYDEDFLVRTQSDLVGGLPSEVSLMNSLTVNLHLLLIRFYSPKEGDRRKKILLEAKTFPSDYYAIESQIRLHGLDPADCIEAISPREGEHTIRTEDLLQKIHAIGDDLALVAMSGVHYYTGQLFDIPKVTEAAHSAGALAIWDLAHAVGNVDLLLHEWKVDGACWCTYKYLNGGPGNLGGFFIHESHFNKPEAPRLAGWWSHNVSSRFEMNPLNYEPSIGASEFRISNVPILSAASLSSALEVFQKTNMQVLRAKSILLTGFLEQLLLKSKISEMFRIISPSDPAQRGSQLSLLFACNEQAKQITAKLEERKIFVDYRKPGLVRVAPNAMYCSFGQVAKFVKELTDLIEAS